jgi:hypothetical protein
LAGLVFSEQFPVALSALKRALQGRRKREGEEKLTSYALSGLVTGLRLLNPGAKETVSKLSGGSDRF